MVMMHVRFIGPRRHYGEIAGKNIVRLFFLLFLGFSVESEFQGTVFGAWFFGVSGLGGPGTLGRLPFCSMLVLMFVNVGGWLTHVDLALEVGVHFLVVVEHRLIPARVRSEWTRLWRKGLASV